jgi:pyrroloquinoline quinone biosynthesis protein D
MMVPSRTAAPRRQLGVLAQQVTPDDPSLVLLNPTSGEYYTLDDVGTRVWQLCDGKRTIADIAATIAQEYDAPPEVIEHDVVELVKELVDEALVVAAV